MVAASSMLQHDTGIMESCAALMIGHRDHGRLIFLKQQREHISVDIAAGKRFLVGDHVECCSSQGVLAQKLTQNAAVVI